MFKRYLINNIDLRFFRNGFLCLSLGVMVFTLGDGLWLTLKPVSSPKTIALSSSAILKTEVLQPLKFYDGIFDHDTMFGKISKDTGVTVTNTPITELVKDFRLKGTILIDEPEAILEDAKTQKTTFLKKGNQLGELLVKEVAEGSLILAYKDEQITLKIQ